MKRPVCWLRGHVTEFDAVNPCVIPRPVIPESTHVMFECGRCAKMVPVPWRFEDGEPKILPIGGGRG